MEGAFLTFDMELTLTRTYRPEGTNGILRDGNQFIVYTIELPWQENKPGVSCIPEGRYELVKRFSIKYQWHYWLKDVPNRSLILIHPANDARKELRGCIAPVTFVTGIGKGSRSKLAFKKLSIVIDAAMKRKEMVFITIKK